MKKKTEQRDRVTELRRSTTSKLKARPRQIYRALSSSELISIFDGVAEYFPDEHPSIRLTHLDSPAKGTSARRRFSEEKEKNKIKSLSLAL